MQQARGATHNNALDGLRVLSIVAILMYHLNLPWLPSGHMGVVVFLVLSGYLATNTIVRVYDREDRVRITSLFRAWGRRFMRIWPSILALVAVVGTLCALLNQVLFTKMRPDVLPSLGFFLNWSYILRDVSYFDLIGGTSPLLHLWYLGCDLQFFAAWTLVLSILLKRGKTFARRSSLVLAIVSAAWMAYLYVPGGDPSRIYYGTDTRAFSLLLGAWLALAFPLGKEPVVFRRLLVKDLDESKYGPGRTRATVWTHLLGLVSIAAMVAAMVLVRSDSPKWYYGGMFAFSLTTVVFVATLLAPTTLPGLILGIKPLKVLGERSFSLYLWHYPIFLLMGANKDTTSWEMRLAAVGVSIVAAEISLRLVERPFSPIAKKAAADQKAADEDNAKHAASLSVNEASTLHKSIVALSTLSIIGCGIYTCYALEKVPDASLVPEDALVSTGSAADAAMDVSQNKPQEQASNAQQGANGQAGGQPAPQAQSANATQETPKHVEVSDTTIVTASPDEMAIGHFDPVLIGDSVPGDAGNEFVPTGYGWEKRLPNSLIDTFIGRNPYQALEVLRGYIDQDAVGKVVVLACFSNSTPYPETLDAMIEAAGPDRQIYLVGTVNPDGFQDAANANLQEAADAHDNVHYVDWPSVLDGHMEEYLWADATHLRPEGAQVYVDMIVRAIAQDMVDAGGTASEE